MELKQTEFENSREMGRLTSKHDLFLLEPVPHSLYTWSFSDLFGDITRWKRSSIKNFIILGI